MAKGNRKEIKSINNYLGQVRTLLGNCYQQLQLKGRMLSAEAIKDAYLGTGEEVYTLSRLVEYHNETAKTVLKWSTLKHYSVTQRYLTKFLDQQFRKKENG